jgi:nucleotide-binding universal stress UspA family protein
MNEVLLVVLSRPETALGLLSAALAVADAAGPARIEALVVRMPAEATFLPSEEVLPRQQRVRWEAREADRAAAIEEIYRTWRLGAEAKGNICDWIAVEALPGAEVAARGRRADLIVIDRPLKHADGAAREIIHAALFDSHRPVLVVPAGFTAGLGRRVAIAWRDDGRAIKAVIPALRYFADAEISLLAGYRGNHAPEGMPAPLAEHGVEAQLFPLPIGSEPFGKTLLAKADELGADLLVMGAYIHSPLVEFLLGGVTRYVLGHAEIPVLLRH